MTAKRLISVRRATAAEEADIRGLQDASLRILGVEHYSAKQIASLIENLGTLDTSTLAAGTCFVAVVDGDIVASGAWTLRPAQFGRAKDQPEILGIFVDPLYAQSGLAARILDAIESDASRLGYAHAEVATIYGGRDFYSARGYRDKSIETVSLPGDVELSCTRMAKSLPEMTARAA